MKQGNKEENSKFVVNDKKKSSEILADENRKTFLEKVKLGKFSAESENFSRNRGECKTGECIIASGGWTPLQTLQHEPNRSDRRMGA